MQLKDFLPRISRMQRIISNDREKRNVIARRSRSNLIFALVKKFLLIFTFNFLLLPFAFSQQTYNLEIIFKRTNWNPDTIRSYGNALSTAGDLNQDGFDDIVYSVFIDNWYGFGYVFYGSPSMDTFPDLILKCENEGQPLMAICSGDLNGDSISDVIIGEGQAGNWGKVFIYFGGPGMDSLPDLTLNGEPLNAWPFGISVACGDINGDAFEDLIVGSYDNGDLNGRVYVYYGGPLLDTLPDVIINGQGGESMGITVGSGGDVNSDGFEDIVAGAFNNDEAGFWAGKVYVFLGGNPMDTIPDCWLHGEGANLSLGWFPVDIVKNGLIFDNVLTGNPLYPYGFPSYAPGKLYVLFGGSPMDTLVDWFKHGEDDSSSLGQGSSSAGYMSADDELGEFAAGAPIGAIFYGKGSIWLSNAPLDTIEDAYLKGNIQTYLLGWVVASAGDVNGDGFDEVMFSNYVADSNQTVWVCRYTGPGIEETAGRSTPYALRFAVYPNPFSTTLDIRWQIGDKSQKMSIKIYDVTGREVFWDKERRDKETGRQGEIKIDTRGLPAGVYFVQVGIGEERMIKKVIKIK